jgi:hypothetical protein
MSVSGVAVEEIARLAGHASSRTTETIYRHELRPVITTGAVVMDKIFMRRSARDSRFSSAIQSRRGDDRAGSVSSCLSWNFRDIQEGPILWMTIAVCCT